MYIEPLYDLGKDHSFSPTEWSWVLTNNVLWYNELGSDIRVTVEEFLSEHTMLQLDYLADGVKRTFQYV